MRGPALYTGARVYVHGGRAYQVNGVWPCMREEIALMLPQKRGPIVNTAPVAGHTGLIGYPAYTASMHAMMGLTKVAALEYAQRGICVNAICPGIIDTPLFQRYSKKAPELDYAAMERVGELGESDEVAERCCACAPTTRHWRLEPG
ncbi:MAG: SDR family NAD(P)-dependent oxidoreductase [Candidatus Binataceae bacterium]